MTPPRDDFDGPSGPGLMTAARGWRVPAFSKARFGVLAGSLVVIVGGIAIMVGHHTRPTLVNDEAPIIHADPTPYRVKPQEPGGMPIPYHDSTVFDALHSTEAAPTPDDAHDRVENLLGMPEQPLPREKLFPAQTVKPAAPATPEPQAANVPVVVTSAKPPAAKQLAGPPVAPIAVPTTLASQKPSVVAKAPPAAPVAEVKATSAPAGGDAYVQLGAVQSEPDAQKVWSKAQAASGSALAGLSLHVEKATLARGIFYRVQGGPVSDGKAKEICAALNHTKAGSCLVAHR